MKNYLIITVGTRDVQIRQETVEPNNFEVEIEIRREVPFRFVRHTRQPDARIAAKPSDDFPDFYTINPRTDGETILKEENWSLFRPILDIPLIQPALEHLKNKSVPIDIIMLVFTDQLQAFEEGRVKKKSYIAGDTVFFAEIIERFILEDRFFEQTHIDLFGRYDSVADMAVQYDEFRKIKDDLISDEEVGKVYLFAQGGIDQINQALTLRLIETFEGQVVYLQNADGHQVQELDFPRRFVNVLNKQKVLKHLADFDFGYIDKALYQDKLVCHLAQYAARRLALQHNQLKTNTDVLLKEEKVKGLWTELDKNVNTDEEKLIDLYLSAKISAHQQSYLELLHKLYTLNENLFRHQSEQFIGKTGGYFESKYGRFDVNQPWIDKLNKADIRIVPFLQKNGVSLSNPNRHAYQRITELLLNNPAQAELFRQLALKLEILTKMRNEIAHQLGSTTKNEINQRLGADYPLEALFTDLDQIFNITGFGIYDIIRDEIKAML